MTTDDETKGPRRLRRVVIKEELVELTGGAVPAVLLGQLLYWQDRTRDVDAYLAEEKLRLANVGQVLQAEPTRGWFYKSAEQLGAETMLGLAPTTIRAHLKTLVERGWVSERQNPYHKWDRTKQYRVEVSQVMADLAGIGYALEGWALGRASESEDGTPAAADGTPAAEDRKPGGRAALPKTNPQITTAAGGAAPPDAAAAAAALEAEGIDRTVAEQVAAQVPADVVADAIESANAIEARGQRLGNRQGWIVAAARQRYVPRGDGARHRIRRAHDTTRQRAIDAQAAQRRADQAAARALAARELAELEAALAKRPGELERLLDECQDGAPNELIGTILARSRANWRASATWVSALRQVLRLDQAPHADSDNAAFANAWLLGACPGGAR